ncbi:murein transglycosylase [Blastomyces dermatitidis ATCC 18188]|uniref:Crh-like protein n=1 Tax=Ajellomyces dermatitidis (strain ATCC 18188 / CBS 674.68) TaxID=653446 RepID=F2TJY1_AJEDA|nr:murein transglycosylase [Blastomyces dermatitidis ATCC 18188]
MKLSSGSVAALAMSLFSGSSLVAAQTWTACNPMQKTCPPNPALGGTADFEFHTASARFDILGGSPSYGADGASLAVAKQGDSPTLISKFYIMFGHVEFVIKAASGRGIVSSAVLQSDTLDEVDWEWLGVDNGRVQTNYFGKNQQGTFDRGQFHSNPGNQNGYHTYSIDWDSQRILWQIDGSTVRTLTAAEAGASYPQTPMQVKAGVWAGGDPTNPPGTIEWAGGPTDYSAGPYVMGLKSIAVTDYSTGTEYRYTDTSGNWGSIEAVGGKVNGRGTPGSGQQVESSIPPAEATRPPPTKGIIHPSGYPWVPSTTHKPKSTPSITSYPGLPSDWIVTDSGRASTPSTASRTSQPTSQSSPSSSASSSARGPESSPSITATGFVTSPTVTPSPSATDSAGATVAPGTGAANGNFHMSYGVAAMCALIGAVIAF